MAEQKVKVKVLRGLVGDDGEVWAVGETRMAGLSFAVHMANIGKVAPVGDEVEEDPVAQKVEKAAPPKRRTRSKK